ncbi:MAG: hypothetical protein JXA64_04490 [Candidatus Fermentibacteraceae bacterium]|nr:hypothetical protein [Candidatus Fermentibacteraceae bacterium]MBN2608352.1 hypothetical protein [Candidatus Fermentibacteraceae bacterium]
MIPFLYFAVADTIVAPMDYETVYVHEWGVIEVDLSFPEALGAEWGYLGEDGVLEPWTEYEVEAPVIWFHGVQCRGTLTVSANQGYFTTLLPHPDSLIDGEGERMMSPDAVGSQTAVWRDISVSPEMMELEESIPVAYDMGGFGWAIPFWREVGGNFIAVPGSAYRDSFIYYECTAASIPGMTHDCQGGDMTYGYCGEALVFSPSGDGLQAGLAEVDGGIEAGERELTDTEILSVICGWSGELKSSEIQALWNTWEPAIRRRCMRSGERLIMFPLTPEQTESVSSIRFQPNGGNRVVYSRLFLAIGSI